MHIDKELEHEWYPGEKITKFNTYKLKLGEQEKKADVAKNTLEKFPKCIIHNLTEHSNPWTISFTTYIYIYVGYKIMKNKSYFTN